MTFSDVKVMNELECWDGFAGALKDDDRELFNEMLGLCSGYFPAMHARDSPLSSEALFMSLLLIQHKTIAWLTEEIEKLKGKRDERLAV